MHLCVLDGYIGGYIVASAHPLAMACQSTFANHGWTKISCTPSCLQPNRFDTLCSINLMMKSFACAGNPAAANDPAAAALA